MRRAAFPVLLAILIGPVAADMAQPANHPLLQSIAGAVSPVELRSTIEKLVGFGTRHTLSDTQSATRGIGAAREWVKRRFAEISHDCGSCLDVQAPS